MKIRQSVPGLMVCIVLATALSGCSGMSTSPMERKAINGMIDKMNSAKLAYYQQYRRSPSGFTDIATLKSEITPTKVYMGNFGTFASQYPCELHQKEILCDKTFEYYKQVRYEWHAGRIAVSAVPGKMSQPLDAKDE